MTSTAVLIAPRPKTREWAKQVGLWLAIATLIPLTAWYATAAFAPPPDEAEYQRQLARFNSPSPSAPDLVQREQLERAHEEAQKAFYRRMFWVTYPIGLLAFLVGLVIPLQAIGAGFMFGGMAALSCGCYSAWDVIGRWAHFWSLIIALLLIVPLGFWHFARPLPTEHAAER